MSKKVNIAVQLIPVTTSGQMFDVIDKAIGIIKKAGVNHMVCPFETVMEGEYEELLDIIREIQEACFSAGAPELIMNLKIHMASGHDIRINDKMANYTN
jgi:uncharacterized protein YqgV (UPF0045/DUF77 family)